MEVEQESVGGSIDRRSALKKAAAAGVVVWTAPTLLSSTVSADHICTLKCAPQGAASVTLAGLGRKGDCRTDGPPGGESRVFYVDSVDFVDVGGTVTCPCDPDGGTAEIDFETTEIIYFDTIPNQGVRTDILIGQVSVKFTCLDRQDRPVISVCDFDVVASFSGSCQGTGNQLQPFTLVATGSCSKECG